MISKLHAPTGAGSGSVVIYSISHRWTSQSRRFRMKKDEVKDLTLVISLTALGISIFTFAMLLLLKFNC